MSPIRGYLVKDYMTSDPVTIPDTGTLAEAMQTMTASNTYSLIVVDGQKKVIGIISLIDIIKEIIPDYLEEDRHILAFEAQERFAERIHERSDSPVKSFMTKKVVTITPRYTLIEAATLLTENRIHQLPVVDDSGVLVGYIGRTKIREAITDVLKDKG